MFYTHSPKKSPQVTTALMRIVVAPYMHTPRQRRLLQWTLYGLGFTILCNCLLAPFLLYSWFPPLQTLAQLFTITVTVAEIVLLICVHFSIQKKEEEKEPWTFSPWQGITGSFPMLIQKTTEHVPVPLTEQYPSQSSSISQERPLGFSRAKEDGL